MHRPTLVALPTVPSAALAVETRVHAFAARHAVTALRLALGFVFVLFGSLKFFPNLSPAQGIAEDATHVLFLGIFPDRVDLTIVAVLEVTVGACLLANRAIRLAALLLLVEMVGILSPLVLLPGMLFDGPHHLPNLLGQYILKDAVLLASVLVLLAVQRGGRIVPGAAAAGQDAGRDRATTGARGPRAQGSERPLGSRRQVSAATVAAPRVRLPMRTLLGSAPAARRDRRLGTGPR